MITFIHCDTDTTTESIVDVAFIGRKTTFIRKQLLSFNFYLDDVLHSQKRLISIFSNKIFLLKYV